MKQYCFNIATWHADSIFSPIRSKQESIKLLMQTLKIMFTNEEVTEKHTVGKIVLVISKMSRLFYFSQDKYFSVIFPFTVTETLDGLIYSSKHISNIDSMITSDVITVISATDSFDSDCIFAFSDSIADIAEHNSNFWAFFKGLLLYEDGYIRYDYDEEHENCRLHPLNHYDVFYSSGATFKIGLKNKIEPDAIIDLLRLESNCHYLEIM